MRTTFLLAIALPALMACASTPLPTPDTPAQLLGCDMEPSLPGLYERRGVLLQFSVDKRGQPLVETARFVPTSTSATPAASEILEARQILASCMFEPALHEGEPVSSRRYMHVALHSR